MLLGIDCIHVKHHLSFDTSGSYREEQELPCTKQQIEMDFLLRQVCTSMSQINADSFEFACVKCSLVHASNQDLQVYKDWVARNEVFI